MVLVILSLSPIEVSKDSLKIRFGYHDFSGTAGIHIIAAMQHKKP
jgi:hypothetical protein